MLALGRVRRYKCLRITSMYRSSRFYGLNFLIMSMLTYLEGVFINAELLPQSVCFQGIKTKYKLRSTQEPCWNC